MAADLCTCPLTKTEKNDKKTQAQKNKKAKKSEDKSADKVAEQVQQGDVMYPSDLLLSDEELMENKYPFCGLTEV